MKVLVIDDHPVFVDALTAILKKMRRGMAVDTAGSVNEALTQLEMHPDYQFILLDLALPGLDGFALLRVLEQRKLPIPVIVISSSEDYESIHACLDAGAMGYIPKSLQPTQISQAIEQIMQGEIYIPEKCTNSLSTLTTATCNTASVPEECSMLGITSKSYQVLRCVAEGHTNKEIAQQLHISVHTVKAHLARLFRCLHTNNRMDTVMEAVRLGIIEH